MYTARSVNACIVSSNSPTGEDAPGEVQTPYATLFSCSWLASGMEVDQGLFPRLMVGAFALAILGFMFRGFGQLVVGSSTARLVATPVFILGVVCAVIGFVLSVLVKVGVLDTEER
jgi:hypothetical protein